MRLEEIFIKNYRSVSKLKIRFKEGKFIVICGANNVGKTNFLRALNLFFSLDVKNFDADTDIPYQIAEATRGHGYKTEIVGKFSDGGANNVEIKVIFTKKKNVGNVMFLSGKKNGADLKESEIRKFISDYRFIFIESSNVDLSKRIAEIVNDDVLLGLDKLRRRQTEPLEKLNEFIDKAQTALHNIEDDVTKILKEYTADIEGIDSRNWKTEIMFPEFVSLRDAISGLIRFTLCDTNKRNIDTKGSGIQKIIVLSLIKYISEKSPKKIIWGIDEPEAFLQPALQKKVCGILRTLSKEIPIIVTTHSNHFIDVHNLAETYLFEGKFEQKEYARRKGQIFYKTETLINDKTGIEKVIAIKRYLGVNKNDSWEILPYNILVEGEEDKDYLTALIEHYGFEVPNIIVAGGADKIKGYLQFLNEFVDELDYKPKIVCLVDHDGAGKGIFQQLSAHATRHSFTLEPKYIHRFDGEKSADHEYTVEDLVPPEVFFHTLNKFLRKKDYNVVRKSEIRSRTVVANDKRKIIEVATDLVAGRNSSKERLEINQEGIKKFVCKSICKSISNEKYNDELKEQESIKAFIKSICTCNV